VPECPPHLGIGDAEREQRGSMHDAAATSDAPAPTGGSSSAATSAEDDDEEDTLSYSNVIDAAAGGAADGLRLALTVGAMLLAFISLIALINLLIGTVGGWFGADDLTFQQILGWVFAPIMVMIGVPLDEAVASGSFVGQKIVVNEFVAFAGFGPEIDTFSPKTAAIITFADRHNVAAPQQFMPCAQFRPRVQTSRLNRKSAYAELQELR